MLCERIYGKLSEIDTAGKAVEYVDIEWHEAFKKIHRKRTSAGREIGIRMDDSVLARGLLQDDVIYMDESLIIAVNTPPCEVIDISFEEGQEYMAAKVCYETGNRHAPLFWGESQDTFVVLYDGPMLAMLEKIPGVKASRVVKKLDFDRRISSGMPHSHHHSHGM